MPDYRQKPRSTNNSAIARIRIERGMTQQELAEKIGVTYSNVSRWERGEVSPTIKSMLKIAAVLGCSLDDLVDAAPE